VVSIAAVQAVDPNDLFTRREGYPSKRVYLTFTPFQSVYKAARVTRVSGLPYLCARVTLAGGLTISLVNFSGRVTRLPG